MKELIEYIVKNLVTNPEAVVVEENRQPGMADYLVTVDPSDMGIVIGKGGQMIKALRKLLTVRAIVENVRVNLQINEPPKSDTSEETPEGEASETPAQESTPEEATPEETPAEETPSDEPEAAAAEEPKEEDSAEESDTEKSAKE